MPTTRATDGTTVHFLEAPGTGPAPWLEDFVVSSTTTEADLERVDHLGLPLPFERFDEGVLFFTAVLGMSPHEALEIADTHGLVRSRALTDASGLLRVALNVPLLGDGSATAEPRLQHVAFHTDDLVTTARRMRARGLPTLPIPDNYYDDLFARYDLPEARVAAMREHDLMYDRSANGEFLHLFTPPLDGRLFFEVVQRVGDYEGYGAPNAAVRMAAQRAVVGGPPDGTPGVGDHR